MYILGISCYYHDSAAALLKDGMIVAAADEERFTRKKHDNGYPTYSINFCLKQAGITHKDLDYVVFYEKPLMKFERILMTSLDQFPYTLPVFRESMIAWFNQKLWIKGQLISNLDIPDDKLLFVEHHLSHAASAFFCSPFEKAAIITIDGVGEWTTTTIGKGTAFWDSPTLKNGANISFEGDTNKIELIKEINFPHSLGLLYSAFTAFLGFAVNDGEYKVMGMAPYGHPNRVEDVYKVIEVNGDGSFKLGMDYFSFHRSISHSFSNKFEGIFGKPREYESDFYTETTHPRKDHPLWDENVAKNNQRHADIAASIQLVTEDIILKMARHAYECTRLKETMYCGRSGVKFRC